MVFLKRNLNLFLQTTVENGKTVTLNGNVATKIVATTAAKKIELIGDVAKKKDEGLKSKPIVAKDLTSVVVATSNNNNSSSNVCSITQALAPISTKSKTTTATINASSGKCSTKCVKDGKEIQVITKEIEHPNDPTTNLIVVEVPHIGEFCKQFLEIQRKIFYCNTAEKLIDKFWNFSSNLTTFVKIR